MNAAERATLAAEARRFLEAEFSPAETRSLFDEPLGYREDAWRKMCELGWLGVAVDLDVQALTALSHEAGRALLPGPFLPTAALGVPLLAASSDPLLPHVLSGESILAVAADPAGVPDAAASEHIIVLREQDAVIIDTSAAVVEPLEWMDLARRIARVRPDSAPTVATLSGIEPERALDVARVAIAAESLGAAERALEIATAYAKERMQFGRPIGSFQAVQHLLAQMLERVELTRASVIGAARALDAGDPSAHEAALIAKAASGESCVRVTADAIQVHGGIGFTWEHDIHRYYRKTVANTALYGTPAWCQAQLATTVFS